MRLVIGSDHAGFVLKTRLLPALREWGHEVEDVGCFSPDPVDFPDIAVAVGEAVTSGRSERGLLVCGTGVGAAIAANKLPGIRAALCHDGHSAHQAVEHDDANVLCLGAQIVGEWLALDLVRIYLDARFAGGEDFDRRLRKIAALDRDRTGPERPRTTEGEPGRAETEAVIRRYRDAWRRGDGEAAMALWADDVTHVVPGKHRLAGNFVGKRSFLETYGRVLAELGGAIEVVAVRDMLIGDAHAVLLVTERAIRGERSLEFERVVVYRITDGRIAETWSYDADPYALDAFWA